MNYTRHGRLSLVQRNEGKLKSYESCFDVRAWSHDVGLRDRYLREWIKTDMPICVIPISTLANSLRTMTYKNRGKITPRCHPNCKSKVVLESICTSCHAMKGCLQKQDAFEKYFEEEEFETCNWPCERCLDALKSIKMFWKVIMEKVFRISVPKPEDLPRNISSCTDSVRAMAKSWQTEMVNQAWLVSNLSQGKLVRERNSTCRTIDGLSCTKVRNTLSLRSCKNKTRESDPILVISANKPHRHRKISRSISVKVKNHDVACETCDFQKDIEECEAMKNNLFILQQQFNDMKLETEKLKRENNSLKLELHNCYNGFSLKTHLCTGVTPPNKPLCILPKPFDGTEDFPTEQPVTNADSEMIITMKNCKNPYYKNVSLLQVLHKTNDPVGHTTSQSACRKEDPLDLLSKMQNVFGSIVRREMGIVNDKRRSRTKISEINASFHRITCSKSVPSCSTLDASSRTSFFQCVCTKDMK